MVPAEDAGLARFGIYFLSIKGTKLDNNTLSTSVVLCNIQMDDMRQNTNSQIRQYLSRKDWVQPKMDTDEIIDACYNERNFMVGDPAPPQLSMNLPVEEPVERPPGTPPRQIISIDIRRLEAHFVARTYESLATVK